MDGTPRKIVEVKGGWAAVGEDWAVFARSKEEVIAKYQTAIDKHAEILKRGIPTNIELTTK